MKKILIVFTITLVAFFAAKKIVASRASSFILECATSEEIEEVSSTSTSEEQKKNQIEIAEKTLACVKAKQNYLEEIFANLMGANLFK